MRQATGRGTAGDDAARFLHELRELRDGAGLGQAELAARAHYPYDSIKAAEVGPALPDLPVLSAYVRGCGGTTEEWEERWRSLTRTPSLPVSAARLAGQSAAASAGARISSVAQEGDTPDPSVIIAALNRVAEEMAAGPDDGTPQEQAGPRSRAETAAEPSPAVSAPAVPVSFPQANPLTEGKTSGWDPIRVSSAWPAIPDSADGTRTASSSAAASSASASGAAGAAPAVTRLGSRTKIAAAAAVLLCLLVVLLAIFA